jgi:integrase
MITEAGIKSALAKAPKVNKTVELKDGGERGAGRLVLVVRPFDTRVTSEWYAYSYRGGRRATAKIGAYPAMGLAAARKEFRERYAPSISAGRAPVGAKARSAASTRDATLLSLFEDYLTYLGERSSASVARRLLENAAKAIGKNKIASTVTSAEISQHLGTIHGRGSIVTAFSSRAYMHAAFQRALKSEHDYTKCGAVKSWGLTANPVSAIPSDPEAQNRVGNRHLSPAEWVTLWHWVKTQEAKWVAAPAIRLSMVCGQRAVELLQLTPRHYDAAEKILDWVKTKNGMPHCIPLPRQAIEIMAELRPNAQGLYFPKRARPSTPTGYTATEKLIKQFLLEHPTIEKFTMRDLRRTWKTLTGAAGLSKEIRDRLQNHMADGSRVSAVHYDRWTYLPEKRAGMELWSDYVDVMLSNPIKGDMAETLL